MKDEPIREEGQASRGETNEGEGQASTDAVAEQQPEWRTAGPLLDAPGRLTRLVETTLILSVVTGVLYAWGLTYYYAFSNTLGLGNYHFAFQVQSQEAVVAGAYVMMYLFGAAPVFFGSASLALMAVAAMVAAAHLVVGFLHWLWRWLWRQIFYKLLPQERLRDPAPADETRPAAPGTERAVERIARAAESYFVFALFLLLVIMILRWGDAAAAKFGTEVASKQLASCPQVEVTFGENEKINNQLCGRIGGDYVLRAPEVQEGPQRYRYVIVKEAAIKQIIVR